MLTRKQAMAALAVVKKRYTRYPGIDTLKLYKDWEDAPYALVWEEGPYEWAYRAVMGGINDEVATLLMDEGIKPADAGRRSTEEPLTWPDGVQAEPYYTYALALYED